MQRCLCGKFDFKEYLYEEDDELLGVACSPCKQEWLKDEYLTESGRERLIFGREELRNQANPSQEIQESFMVKGSRTKIGKHDLAHLKPGDHITWHRPYLIWHHAIVVRVDARKRKLEIIHWQAVKGGPKKCQIVQKEIHVDKEKGDLYRIDYPSELVEKNPPKLVLARARSRIGETGYDLLKNNCEGFAAFCRTGVNESTQIQWLWGKVKEVFGNVAGQIGKNAAKVTMEEVAKGVGKIGIAETIEAAARASNKVGAGLVVAIEGGYCIWDISQLHKNRNEGKISGNDFVESASQRVTEAVATAGLAIGGGLAGEAAGAAAGAFIGTALFPIPVIGAVVGTAIGVFVGSVAGGTLGSIGGKVVGSAIGPFVGKAIVKVIKRDDRAVTNINDLKTADQVVVYGWLLHPRHHAIVTDTNPMEGKVKVVHNLYKRGIVEEWVDFTQPVYKVIYRDDGRPADEVVMRARSKVGTKNYSIVTHNCKDFARWCKEKN